MPGPPPPRTPWPIAALLVGLSVLGALVACEVTLRIAAGDPFGRPNPASGLRLVGAAHPASHDPELGFVPTPGYAGSDNAWGVPVSITAAGIRANGSAPPAGTPILAVGDSYTFGDEVGDAETWPAQLERLVGRPVLNGGVFGYGLDQIVLRAERLLRSFPADTLLVGLIFDDVLRTEYVYRYAWKPWFAVADGALALHGVPVPPPDSGRPRESAWRRALRRSYLADWIYRRVDPQDWLVPDAIHVHRDGERVSQLLVDRLAGLARARNLRVLVVLQWVPGQSDAPAQPVVERARQRGLSVLEIEPLLQARIASGELDLDALFYRRPLPNGALLVSHMTAEGNAQVARAIAPWVLDAD